MATSWGSVIEHLRGNKGAWRPTTTTFPIIDVEQFSKDLQLEERADQCKAKSSDDQKHSVAKTVLQAIATDIGQRAYTAQSQFHAALRMYAERIREARVQQDARVRIQSKAQEAISNFRAQIVEDQNKIEPVRAHAVAACQEFDHFRQKHGLAYRAPRIASGKKLLSGWLIIGTIVLLETIANGFFFAQGSEAGLIGGVAEATFLSLVNVSLGAAIGLFAFRYIQHRHFAARSLAAIALAALLPATLVLNLLIAHYREAFAASQGLAVSFSGVLETFATNPFVLDDAKSWMLGAVGLIINVLASYKFYTMHDPYPGYGPAAKRRNEALEDLDQEAQNLIETLTDQRDDASEGMLAVTHDLASKQDELEMALSSRKRLVEEYRRYLEDLETLNDQMQIYFLTHAELAANDFQEVGLASPSDSDHDFGDHVEHSLSNLEQLLAEMKSYLDELHGEYREAVAFIDTRAKVLAD